MDHNEFVFFFGLGAWPLDMLCANGSLIKHDLIPLKEFRLVWGSDSSGSSSMGLGLRV